MAEGQRCRGAAKGAEGGRGGKIIKMDVKERVKEVQNGISR